jgi:hypothetical protein
VSINRTGLARSAFELDDRGGDGRRRRGGGWTGVKHMTRIDISEVRRAEARELLQRVLEKSSDNPPR